MFFRSVWKLLYATHCSVLFLICHCLSVLMNFARLLYCVSQHSLARLRLIVSTSLAVIHHWVSMGLFCGVRFHFNIDDILLLGNEMIAPLDVCPSWERRLPSRRLPVSRLPVTEETFTRQDVCPSVVCPSRKRRLPVKTEKMLKVRTGKILYLIMQWC